MDERKIQLNLDIIIPAEEVLDTAVNNLNSDDENVRAVSKTIIDLTEQATRVKEGMANNQRVDLAPYFDFWFADAIRAAHSIIESKDKSLRNMARCLIDQEKAVLSSKTAFLEEMKRQGIKPNR